MTAELPIAQVFCQDCGYELPANDQPPTPCPECGSTTRHLVVRPITATASAEAHVRGKTKSGERHRTRKGKTLPAVERTFGDSFNRDRQEWVNEERTVDRKGDLYEETIHDGQGTVYRHVSEPLSEHQGHGSARQSESD